MSDDGPMNDVLWKTQFPLAYQKVRQIPLARNLLPQHWLFLCFEQGLLSSAEYLDWACKYYGLAKLEPSFLERQFSATTYQKYKDIFHWGPQAVPLFEWDGVVFVACLEPSSVPDHLEVLCRPVLASFETLSQAWRALDSGMKGSVSPVDSNPPPMPMPMQEIDRAPMVTEAPPSAPEAPPMNTEPPPMIEMAPGPEEEVVGLPSFDADPVSSLPTEPVVTEKPSPGEDLFALQDDPEMPPMEAATSEAELEVPEGLGGFGLETPVAQSSRSSSTPIDPADEIFGVSAAPSLPKAPPLSAAPPSASKAPPVKERLMAPPPPPPAPASARSEPKLQMVPPPPPMKSQGMTATPPPMEEDLQLCFTKAYSTYRNLMILKIDGDVAVPFRWDDSFQAPGQLEPIPLDTPSIFRIAAKTQKPFHGPVVPNPTNESFFHHWMGGRYPAAVSIIPMHVQQLCVGLVFGAADEMLDRKDSLSLMIETTEKVTQTIGDKL